MISKMMREKLFLGEILERDKVEYGSNNLIKAPTGSGKTHFIKHYLNHLYEGKKLMLVSLTSLKDKYGKMSSSYTTQDIRRKKLNITDNDIYVMTYAEFGHKIKWSRDFMHKFSVIYCDEIHSLFKYYFIDKKHNLGAAITFLFDKYEDITIFYFTATTYELDIFIDKEYKDLYENVKIIDYYDNEDIKRYVVYSEFEFSGTDGIKWAIDNIKDMRLAGRKGLIYNERIESMKDIEENLRKKGYKVISIWSVNNSKNPMNDEQLYVRNYLLEHEVYPEGYDFIIINASMVEGWNLKDENIEVVILNTLDKTNKEQAIGRFRGNIPQLYVRVEGDTTPLEIRFMNREKTTGVIERHLGLELDTNDKNNIAKELDIRRENNNTLVKWGTIVKILENNNYNIENKVVRDDGKQKRVSIITKKGENNQLSSTSKASKFMAKLKDTNFASVYKSFLRNYIDGNSKIAYNNIKSAYILYVINNNWTERKFADISYLLARDNKVYSHNNYRSYGLDYHNYSDIEILTERVKNEPSELRKLEAAKQAQLDMEAKMEKDLLEYISQNGGK